MLRTNIAHRVWIRPRRDLQRQPRASESWVHTRRNDVVERTQPECLRCVEQRKVLGMGVVVTEQNAHENPAEKLVDIDLALLRLMCANELGHLSIRAFIFGFSWSPEELIEFLEVDFLARFR